MADTLTTMTTLIRDNLDESAAAYWSDAEIQRKAIRRLRELWSRIIAIRDDWYKSTTPATITLAAIGTLKYSLPADFFRVCSIRTTTSGREYVRWRWCSCKNPDFIDGQRPDYQSLGIQRDEILYDIEGVTSLVVSPAPVEALVGSMEYYTLPTDPTTTFQLPDPFLRYVEAGATADCLAKGPVGLLSYWNDECKMAWSILLPLIGAPRSGQNGDHALSAFER